MLEQRLRRSEHEVAKMDLQLVSEIAIEVSEVDRKRSFLLDSQDWKERAIGLLLLACLG